MECVCVETRKVERRHERGIKGALREEDDVKVHKQEWGQRRGTECKSAKLKKRENAAGKLVTCCAN